MPYGKVLVVDDVPTNLEVSKGLLKPYGLYVECVSSGQEAIDLIRKATVRFDLILMDHLMPDIDGITATQIIRHEIDSDYARRVPIIALTANALAGSEAMFLAQGFNAFISKPIDVMRLDEILNRWIRDKQSPETMKQGIQEKAKLTESPLLGGAPSILQESPIKGVDLAAGIARYEQEGIYLGILKSYLNHGKKILAQVRDVSQENLKEYGIAVHGLKGASYGIEADAMGKIAEEQERAAKAGDLERVRDQNPAFLASLHSLLEDISALLEKAEAPAGGKERLKVPDPELLEKLLEAGKHYKSTIMGEIITSLEQYEYEIGGALIPWLRKQIDNLEYEAIQNLLTKLKDADWRVESIWG
jgi:CheY-like chemotaxis protein